jgi:hypothetical protein
MVRPWCPIEPFDEGLAVGAVGAVQESISCEVALDDQVVIRVGRPHRRGNTRHVPSANDERRPRVPVLPVDVSIELGAVRREQDGGLIGIYAGRCVTSRVGGSERECHGRCDRACKAADALQRRAFLHDGAKQRWNHRRDRRLRAGLILAEKTWQERGEISAKYLFQKIKKITRHSA